MTFEAVSVDGTCTSLDLGARISFASASYPAKDKQSWYVEDVVIEERHIVNNPVISILIHNYARKSHGQSNDKYNPLYPPSSDYVRLADKTVGWMNSTLCRESVTASVLANFTKRLATVYRIAYENSPAGILARETQHEKWIESRRRRKLAQNDDYHVQVGELNTSIKDAQINWPASYLQDKALDKPGQSSMNGDIEKECIRKFQAKINHDTMQKGCCAVCWELHFENENFVESIHLQNVTCEEAVSSLQILVLEGVWDKETEPFQFSGIFEDLSGYPLLHKAMDQETGFVSVCTRCSKHISDHSTIPPRAMANNLLFGDQSEEMSSLSIPEKLLMAPIRQRAFIVKLESHCDPKTAQRGVRGQVIAFPQDNCLLKLEGDIGLPRPLTSLPDNLVIIFVGDKQPTEKQLKKIFKVRGQVVRRCLETWRKNGHPAYQEGTWNEEAFSSIHALDSDDSSLLDVLKPCVQRLSHEQEEEVRTATDTYTGEPSGQFQEDSTFTDPMSVIMDGEDEIVMLQNSAVVNANSSPSSEGDDAKNARVALLCKHGDTPISTYRNPEFWTNSMPWLFPLGSGGAEDTRPTSLSLDEWIRHCLYFHDDRFRKDPAFMFVAFKIAQTRERVSKTTVLLKMVVNAPNLQKISNFNHKDLDSTLDGISKNDKRYLLSPEKRKMMAPLLSAIKVVGKENKGSVWSRGACRDEMLGLVTLKGLPSFFITLNPSDINNPLVAFWHAGEKIEFNLDTLMGNYPSAQRRAEIVVEDPVHAAQMFNTTIKAFLASFFGFENIASDAYRKEMGEEHIKGGPLLNGSIFTGVDSHGCNAFYGTVECQGRGSLHLHLLLWIAGQINPEEMMKRIEQAFQLNLEKKAALEAMDDSPPTEPITMQPPTPSQVKPAVLREAKRNQLEHQPWTKPDYLDNVTRYIESSIQESFPTFSQAEMDRPYLRPRVGGGFLSLNPSYFGRSDIPEYTDSVRPPTNLQSPLPSVPSSNELDDGPSSKLFSGLVSSLAQKNAAEKALTLNRQQQLSGSTIVHEHKNKGPDHNQTVKVYQRNLKEFIEKGLIGEEMLDAYALLLQAKHPNLQGCQKIIVSTLFPTQLRPSPVLGDGAGGIYVQAHFSNGNHFTLSHVHNGTVYWYDSLNGSLPLEVRRSMEQLYCQPGQTIEVIQLNMHKQAKLECSCRVRLSMEMIARDYSPHDISRAKPGPLSAQYAIFKKAIVEGEHVDADSYDLLDHDATKVFHGCLDHGR